MRTRGGTLPEMVMNAAVRWCGREVALIMAVFLSASGVCLACPAHSSQGLPQRWEISDACRAGPSLCVYACIHPSSAAPSRCVSAVTPRHACMHAAGPFPLGRSARLRCPVLAPKCMNAHAFMRLPACMCELCVYVSVYACMHLCVHRGMEVYMHTCMDACMDACMSIHDRGVHVGRTSGDGSAVNPGIKVTAAALASTVTESVSVTRP